MHTSHHTTSTVCTCHHNLPQSRGQWGIVGCLCPMRIPPLTISFSASFNPGCFVRWHKPTHRLCVAVPTEQSGGAAEYKHNSLSPCKQQYLAIRDNCTLSETETMTYKAKITSLVLLTTEPGTGIRNGHIQLLSPFHNGPPFQRRDVVRNFCAVLPVKANEYGSVSDT